MITQIVTIGIKCSRDSSEYKLNRGNSGCKCWKKDNKDSKVFWKRMNDKMITELAVNVLECIYFQCLQCSQTLHLLQLSLEHDVLVYKENQACTRLERNRRKASLLVSICRRLSKCSKHNIKKAISTLASYAILKKKMYNSVDKKCYWKCYVYLYTISVHWLL